MRSIRMPGGISISCSREPMENTGSPPGRDTRFRSYRKGITTRLILTSVALSVKTIYLVRLVNATTLRTLTVCDGKIDVIEELTNGGIQPTAGTSAVTGDGSAPIATTPLISKRSDQ